MKVDVYPNITNVEVYENPISVPVEATWEKVVFTVPDPIVNNYDLGRQVATDRDGDYVIQVHYDSTEVDYATDFTVTDTKVNWVSATPLVVGQKITVWYSPKSAYGSVPGSGEVTSLTHLNDVTVVGPTPGQILMRDGNNQFVNRSLTAGDNVSITSNGDGITIASGVINQVNASTIAQGVVRLATKAEAAGVSQALAVTPAGLQEELSDLSVVATSGSYADLSDKPTIPSDLNSLSDVSLSGTLTVGEVIRYNGSTFVDAKLSSTDLVDSGDLARLASPTFTGTPTSPTPAVDDNSTKIATTAYVQTEIAGLATSSQGNAGNVNVGDGSGGFNASTWEVSSNHLQPTANEQYDIGSADNRVRDIYLSNNSLKFGVNNLSLALNNQGKITFDDDVLLTDETFATVASTGAYSDLIGAPTLSNVATSGAYADLIGAPTLATVATSGSYADLSNLPSLANVATSGSFGDLQNTPTASTITAGIVELASLQETSTGTDATKAVTPAGLAAELSGVGTSDKVFEGQAKVEAFDDGNAGGAVIKFSVDPSNTGSPVDVWHIDGNGHIIPQTHEAFDLGNADAKVRHLFLSDNSIKMGNDNKVISLSGNRLNYDGNDVTTDNLLASVATSGSYDDLQNKPNIPGASTDLTDSADLARLASPTFTGVPTAPTAASGTNTTQIATTSFVLSEFGKISSLGHENVIVLDSNRSDTYTEDGSSEWPYKTFASAWSALNTAKDTVFYFNAGTYTVNLTNADAMSKKLSFVGQSKDSVILTPADIAVDCFKLTDKTGGLFFSNLTIQEAKYGIRVVNGTKVTLDTVGFYKCGSDGTVANHDGSKNQADQTAAWNSNQVTDGGACRIENCTGSILIKNCCIDYSFRGYRVQDCTGGGLIINNETLRTLESAIYLASSSYDGANGCTGFEIINNNINEAGNNAILVIGGKDNTIKDNVIRKAWNTPIMMWHTLNTIIDSNRVIDSNSILHNGIGSLGDSWAQISANGATNIAQTGGSFVFQSTNNVFTDCGQGRLSQAYKIAINPTYHVDNTSVMNYPANYNPLLQYSSDNDYSDLTNEVYTQSTNITRKNLVTNFNQQVADLGDINLSALSNGDLLKYNGSAWVNSTLGHTEISGLGTSAPLDAGAGTNNVLKIVDVSGSPGLPSIDGSQLINMTNTQISGLGTAATVDTGTSAGNVVQLDGSAKLPAVDGSQLTNLPGSGDLTVVTADTSLSENTGYVIDANTSADVFLDIPSSGVADGATITVANLSAYRCVIQISSVNSLYFGDGSTPDINYEVNHGGNKYRIYFEGRGIVKLTQSAQSGLAWYAYFVPAVGTSTGGIQAGDSLSYSGVRRLLEPVERAGDKILTGNISGQVEAMYTYCTSYDESTDRSVSFPSTRYDQTAGNTFYRYATSLNGRRVYFENRGSAKLTISVPNQIFDSGIYYRTYLKDFTGGALSAQVLKSGETAVCECVLSTPSGNPTLDVFFQRGGYAPERVTETDSTGTNTTLSTGGEKHKVVLIDNGNAAVTITLPEAINVKSNYKLTLKSRGTGTVTVSRGGSSDLIDADETVSLSEYNSLELIRNSSGWTKVSPKVAVNASDVSGLATVATSGVYSDLSNKPTIPAASTDLTDSTDLARLASPALTGTPTAPTAGSGTNTTQIATTAFVQTAVASVVGGLTYKGTINVADFASTLANAEQGDYYKIATGGTAGDSRVYATNDSIVINADMSGTFADSKLDKIDNTENITSVNGYSSGAINLGINDLSDVTITGASTGEVLRYSGSAWVDAQLSYGDLSGTPTLGTAAAAATTDFLSGTGSDTLGGDLDVGTSDIISASNNAIALAPHGTGVVTIKGNAGGSGRIKLNCENNTHGVTIKGPAHSASATYTLTLPDDDGDADQVLKTDGSGALSWVDQASGGGGWNYSAITANTTAQASYHYSCGVGNQSFTLTLPAISGVAAGKEIRVKNMGTGTITIDSNGSEQIDGSSANYTLDIQFGSITLVSTGSAWEIV